MKNAVTGKTKGKCNQCQSVIKYLQGSTCMLRSHSLLHKINLNSHQDVENGESAVQSKKVKMMLDYVHQKSPSLKEIVTNLATSGNSIYVIINIHSSRKRKFCYEAHP